MKICLWRFFLWKTKIFPLNFWKFLRRFVHGDFSFGIWFWRFFLLEICLWRFFLEDLFWRLNFWKKFNEDLFIEIFPLKNGDFSFWRFVRADFSLKIYSGDWTFEKLLMKICSWRFFLLKMEIFLWSQSEEDEDGLEMMKIYSWWFFFFFWKTYTLNDNNFGWKLMWIAG